jgi:hypothetical protein
MDDSWDEFGRIVSAVLTRFSRQVSHPAPAPQDVRRFTAQLRALIEQRGLPRPLADDECGAPGSMSEGECAPLVKQIVAGLVDPWLNDAARQFVKACFYPEFKVCRDSFREVGRDGACRRQELERALGRLSGAHCVDCPHWTALAADEHQAFLAREWRTDTATFLAHRDVFLPEDFRALRRWLHAAARNGLSGSI